jgi:hypothetical protein
VLPRVLSMLGGRKVCVDNKSAVESANIVVPYMPYEHLDSINLTCEAPTQTSLVS